jgi:hypothetical protein
MVEVCMRLPVTVHDLALLMSSEEACEEWLARIRWRRGFRCRRCAGGAATRLVARRLWVCRACKHQTSVLAGTALHRSRVPRRVIVYAIWMMARHKTSISALQLQRDCGLGSYETAWRLLRMIRWTMRDDAFLLPGQGEDCLLAIDHGRGVFPARHRRQITTVAVERLYRVHRGGRAPLRAGNIVLHVGERLSYRHKPATGMLARTIAANVATWLAGTFHGVGTPLLQQYLHEYALRFNLRRHPRSAVAYVAMCVLR